jgi:predicted RNA-binding protein with PUA domain
MGNSDSRAETYPEIPAGDAKAGAKTFYSIGCYGCHVGPGSFDLAKGQWADGVVDDGARKVLMEGGKSLLPAGVTGARGRFRPGDAVSIADRRGRVFARGIARRSQRNLNPKMPQHRRRKIAPQRR